MSNSKMNLLRCFIRFFFVTQSCRIMCWVCYRRLYLQFERKEKNAIVKMEMDHCCLMVLKWNAVLAVMQSKNHFPLRSASTDNNLMHMNVAMHYKVTSWEWFYAFVVVVDVVSSQYCCHVNANDIFYGSFCPRNKFSFSEWI